VDTIITVLVGFLAISVGFILHNSSKRSQNIKKANDSDPKKYNRIFSFWFTISIVLIASIIYCLKLDRDKTEGALVGSANTAIDTGRKEPKDNLVTKQPGTIQIPTGVAQNKKSEVHNEKITESKPATAPEKQTTVINYINKQAPKADIALLILDSKNQPVNSISSKVAEFYRSKGYTVNTSLFTDDFLESKYLNKLRYGNADVIDMLGVSALAKNIVIGKYANSIENGSLMKYISRARLDVVVISCTSKSQIDVFDINRSNTHGDKLHAESGAIDKIMKDYKLTAFN
jgi:hypothetical protein